PEVPQSALVLIDNRTMGLTALQGGYGPKEGNLVFNRATDMRRQTGSSIKPVAGYGPAIDNDIITGATVIADSPAYLDPQNPDELWPLNFYRSYYGNMT